MTIEVRNGEKTLIDDLQAKFQDWGITTIACDFDDTLTPTRALFQKGLTEAADIFARHLGLTDNKDVFRIVGQAMAGLRHELHVHPSLSLVALHLTALELGIDPKSEVYQKAGKRASDVYDDMPKIFDGAVKTIDLLNATGVRLILTTHAEPEWTWRKLAANGLNGKFAHIHCFDVNYPKSEQWDKVFIRENVHPTKLLTVGDNLHSDILPPVRRGARGVWIRNNDVFSTEKAVDDNHGLAFLEANSIAGVPRAIIAAS
jgi:FMN phosphatase YigB (HAD superfamily)